MNKEIKTNKKINSIIISSMFGIVFGLGIIILSLINQL